MPRPTPEQEAADAQRFLSSGRLALAADRLANALYADPVRRDWLTLLARLIDAADDPLSLAPLDAESTPVGMVAIRAYAMFKLERYHDAIDLLMQCALAAPGKPFLDWGLAWLRKPRALHQVNCLKLIGHFQSLIDGIPRFRGIRGAREALFKRLPTFVRYLRETQICDAQFLLICTTLLRRLTNLEAALVAAHELQELEPGYQSSCALAMIYRERDDMDRAEKWFREALRAQPGDVAVRLDLGDMFWDYNRLDDAERWYREALKLEPNHGWAQPSLYAVNYERTQDPAWKAALDDYANLNPHNKRARDLIDRYGPYFGTYLPEPQEASLSLVRMMDEKFRAGRTLNAQALALSALEAPSVYLAFDLQIAREGREGELTIAAESIPQPDVRYPRAPVRHQIWRYRGSRPIVAVTAPSDRIMTAVAQLAARPYSLKTWLDEAAEIAPPFGPGKVLDFLAVMVHPPQAPRKFTVWEWVQRVQIAAAMIVAKIETDWEGSNRRQGLFDLCNGPLDWTTVAGILALATLADDEPAIADDVAALFNELLANVPQGGYICHLYPLVVAYQRLPNLSPQERQDLAQWRFELERGD